MSSMNFWMRCLVLVGALSIGCKPNPASSTAHSHEDDDAAVSSSGRSKSKKGQLPVKRNVKEIAGNWVVVVNNSQSDFYRWIIGFTRGADGKMNAEFLTLSPEEAGKLQIVSTDVEGDSIKFVVKADQATFDFDGTFQEGFIRGTIRVSPFELMPTRLLPTDEKTLEKFDPSGRPPGTDVMEALVKNKDTTTDQLIAGMREFRTSPVSQNMYSMLIASHLQANFDEAKLNEVIDLFLASAKTWGKRWEARMEMSIGVRLVEGRKFSQLALKHFDAAEVLLENDRPAFQETLAMYRDAAKINISIQKLLSPASNDEIRSSAYSELQALVEKQPYNAEVLYALATEAERIQQVDQGIDYLSAILALPSLENMILQLLGDKPPKPPAEFLKKLWKEKHGSETGALEHVTEVYRQKIDELLADLQKRVPFTPPAEMGNRMVFIELFTGMQCPPCVAADLALDALSKTIPSSQLMILRYHQHIPYPDGLVNQDSEERAAFYEVTSTPTIVIDGTAIDPKNYAGSIQNAINGYRDLRRIVDPRITEKTEIALQVTAAIVDGQLSVTAAATGVPDDLLPSCRLRMAIVENMVHTFATGGTNGIRDHEHVVREMLGGSKGIPPKKGELKYSISMPFADVQQHVVDYINRFEAGRRAEFPAELKPPIRGPLSLVAWVQDGNIDNSTKSRRVLQAMMIPISGQVELGSTAGSQANSEKDIPADSTAPNENATSPEKPKEAAPIEVKPD